MSKQKWSVIPTKHIQVYTVENKGANKIINSATGEQNNKIKTTGEN